MNRSLSAPALIFAASLAPSAYGDNYPSRTIVMVAPLGVGGSTDIIGRIMADAMGRQRGQTIVVENTTGAGGTIGEGRIAHSTPDGYTIGIGQWGTNVANGAIYELNYDLMKDFEPIGPIATHPFFVSARRLSLLYRCQQIGDAHVAPYLSRKLKRVDRFGGVDRGHDAGSLSS